MANDMQRREDDPLLGDHGNRQPYDKKMGDDHSFSKALMRFDSFADLEMFLIEQNDNMTNDDVLATVNHLIKKNRPSHEIISYLLGKRDFQNRRPIHKLKEKFVHALRDEMNEIDNEAFIFIMQVNEIRQAMDLSPDHWLTWMNRFQYEPLICQLAFYNKDFYLKTLDRDLSLDRERSPYLDAYIKLQHGIAQESGGFWNRESVRIANYLQKWLLNEKIDSTTCLTVVTHDSYWKKISPLPRDMHWFYRLFDRRTTEQIEQETEALAKKNPLFAMKIYAKPLKDILQQYQHWWSIRDLIDMARPLTCSLQDQDNILKDIQGELIRRLSGENRSRIYHEFKYYCEKYQDKNFSRWVFPVIHAYEAVEPIRQQNEQKFMEIKEAKEDSIDQEKMWLQLCGLTGLDWRTATILDLYNKYHDEWKKDCAEWTKELAAAQEAKMPIHDKIESKSELLKSYDDTFQFFISQYTQGKLKTDEYRANILNNFKQLNLEELLKTGESQREKLKADIFRLKSLWQIVTKKEIREEKKFINDKIYEAVQQRREELGAVLEKKPRVYVDTGKYKKLDDKEKSKLNEAKNFGIACAWFGLNKRYELTPEDLKEASKKYQRLAQYYHPDKRKVKIKTIEEKRHYEMMCNDLDEYKKNYQHMKDIVGTDSFDPEVVRNNLFIITTTRYDLLKKLAHQYVGADEFTRQFINWGFRIGEIEEFKAGEHLEFLTYLWNVHSEIVDLNISAIEAKEEAARINEKLDKEDRMRFSFFMQFAGYLTEFGVLSPMLTEEEKMHKMKEIMNQVTSKTASPELEQMVIKALKKLCAPATPTDEKHATQHDTSNTTTAAAAPRLFASHSAATLSQESPKPASSAEADSKAPHKPTNP